MRVRQSLIFCQSRHGFASQDNPPELYEHLIKKTITAP